MLLQRTRKMAAEPEPQSFGCVFIPSDDSRVAAPLRGYVEGAIADLQIPVPTSSPMVPYFVAELLQCNAPIEVAVFYDRDASICDWYYQAFASGEQGRPNSVANILRTRKKPTISGDVLVVKTGPMNGIWKWSPDIAKQELAETLWWYQQSGRDIGDVFGERGMRRILGDMA